MRIRIEIRKSFSLYSFFAAYPLILAEGNLLAGSDELLGTNSLPKRCVLAVKLCPFS